MKTTSLYIYFLLAFTLVSCAKMGSPDGGWYDEEPPYVWATSPRENATNFHGKKIHLLFNEYIKLENAQEKVVICPPQIEQPEIKVKGKEIVIELKDTLKENTTYTIDFSNAISDNNEGNPMGNYTFTFSTGNKIDTMEVSGVVVDAENLDPQVGMLVGLHKEEDFLAQDKQQGDTIFRTKSLLRISRTDELGHFVIKGIAPGSYKIFALQDMDGDFKFSQKAEKIAFSDRIIVPSSFQDTRQDTLWTDSLHIKDLVRTPYTHFIPDDVVLVAFTEKPTDRYLIKTERKDPELLGIYFSSGANKLPVINPINFTAKEGKDYIVEHSLKNDTVKYWLRDSVLINNDSLFVELLYMGTDSLGQLVEKSDTIEFIPKIGYERRQKLQEEEYKKWQKEQEKAKKKGNIYYDVMPPKPVEVKWNFPSKITPESKPSFELSCPVDSISFSNIRLYQQQDTTWIGYNCVLRKDSLNSKRYYVEAEWQLGQKLKLEVDSAAIIDIFGRVNLKKTLNFNVGTEEDYGTVTFNISGFDGKQKILQLLNRSGKVLREQKTSANKVTFPYLRPDTYYARVIIDDDKDGEFSTGEYAKDLQPEQVFYYNKNINVKAKWEESISWNPKILTIDKQKPSDLVKQKARGKRIIKNRNAERAKKMGIIYESPTRLKRK